MIECICVFWLVLVGDDFLSFVFFVDCFWSVCFCYGRLREWLVEVVVGVGCFGWMDFGC